MPNTLDQKTHIHSWVRWKKNLGEMNFRCDHPDCNKIQPRSLLLGKRALCSICHGNEIILTGEDLRRAKPRCINCSTTKEALLKKERGDIMDNIMNMVDEEGNTNEEETLT